MNLEELLRPRPKHTAAFDRFVLSTSLDYERWHDGEGYDLAALAEMEPWEREEVVDMMTGRDVTWREVDVLAAIDLPQAAAAIEEASHHHLSIDTRLAASRVLHDRGTLPVAIDEVIARELRALSQIPNGSVRALLLAEEFPTDRVKQALLWASWNQTECAMHCAALLCYLVGVAKEPFDWDLRPLFLRLGEHESYFTRKAAFDELCALVKMELDTTQF